MITRLSARPSNGATSYYSADAVNFSQYLNSVAHLIVAAPDAEERLMIIAAYHQGLPAQRAAELICSARMERLRKLARTCRR